ncbi:type II secretion system protein GspG [Yersinia pestis]|nr:type II secretion system protein GspG [Yersinia pestis]
MSNKNRADQQKAVSDISALENALDMYRLDNGDYPTEQQGIAALVTKPNVPPLPQRYPSDGYIRRLPTDPWGNSYQMNNPGKHGQIDIFSIGPDRLPETEDDIGNWITLSISET